MTDFAEVLLFFSAIVGFVIDWGTQVINWFVSNPLLLVPIFLFFIVGGTIGIVHRAMGR